MDREEAVVGVGVDELGAWRGELGAHQHRDQATDEQEEERVDRVLHADHLVVCVDAEVVLPRARPVSGVILGARLSPSGPVEPVVEAADADEEQQRHGDQRDRQDRFAVDVVLERRMARAHAHDPGQAEREGDAERHHPGGAIEAGRAQFRSERHATCAVAGRAVARLRRALCGGGSGHQDGSPARRLSLGRTLIADIIPQPPMSCSTSNRRRPRRRPSPRRAP